MHFTNYNSSTELTRAIQQARALDAQAEARRSHHFRHRSGDRRGLRRSIGLTLIHLGLRLIPDSPIRGPSTAATD